MEEVYVTLGKEGVSEFEMKKSVFIGHAAPVKTEEEALEYIQEDELVEVTPKSMRLRKILLSEIDRKRKSSELNC